MITQRSRPGGLPAQVVLTLLLTASTLLSGCDDGLTGLPGDETGVYSAADGALYARGGEKPAGGGKGKGKKSTAGTSATTDTSSSSDTSGSGTNSTDTSSTSGSTAPVAPASVASAVVSPASFSLLTGATQQLSLTLYDSSGNQLSDRSVSWATSDGLVASVTTSGLVTALAAGSVVITATSEGVSGRSSGTISAPVVTETLSGIAVYPGESIQSKVLAYPEGTRFVLKAGIHRRQTIIPRNRQEFIGEPGAVLDGEGVTQFAFDLRSAPRTGNRVKGLVIRNYVPVNSGGQRGMIQAYNGTNWIIEDNEIHGSTVTGIDVGAGAIVRRNKIHSNCHSGMGGRPHRGLIENNDVYDNAFCPKEEASVSGRAGMKFTRTDSLTIRGNRVYRNGNNAIWLDIDVRWAVIENNHVYDNKAKGIFYEISYDGIIRNNLVERNTGTSEDSGWITGIAVSTSSRVQVYGNTLRDNLNGIQLRDDNRGSGAFGTYRLTDLDVRDNTIRQLSGMAAGLMHSLGSSNTAPYTAQNNRFRGNNYQLSSLSARAFYWLLGNRTFSQWQGYGQDVNGTVQ